ncbi:bifunctional biotin--[acetyl-CoA-carboxylase] ligase/biotin operon repressor BirA [Pseudoalteromonas denitrificans]|uniref:Bifunctional ligase/repressor BirA n=1 Tax=Pseudoalteromonas denitrificans DSM 6059 TaxID=1123010 RepID=A0A1I1SBU7_9GAMM|nr:bifunctional biotin--[acetyl-CoA-carboxylase] ligase/biotin operon repressor BirA [Pseudoalteromonas denitrificans]SFD42068.1 BirA family transcriptional regulator, biotin operon repressor / biotin-[acetyl-CoA-carboxylase] ligase [Pseudoalteromonas denitrificans DSM 6059]
MKAPQGNKLAILNYLEQAQLATGKFISGQWLGDELEISRAAVAKHIQSLQEMGLDIFKVSGKGYRLSNELNLLNSKKVLNYYSSLTHCETKLEVHPVIDSTNSELMRRIQKGDSLESGTVIVAQMQTAGRGRRGRTWQSPFGANLYYSYYWLLDDGLQAAMGLSIVVGIAIYDTLEKLFGIKVQLKWPNDILVNDKKLAGVLVELDGQPQGPCKLVIGIGLNIKMPESYSEHIDQPWTDLSLLNQNNGVIDKNKLVAQLTHCLEIRLDEYRTEGLLNMHKEWNQLHAFQDQLVTLATGKRNWQGVCEGIDAQGGIKIRQDGEVKSYFGGEISLRKAT